MVKLRLVIGGTKIPRKEIIYRTTTLSGWPTSAYIWAMSNFVHTPGPIGWSGTVSTFILNNYISTSLSWYSPHTVNERSELRSFDSRNILSMPWNILPLKPSSHYTRSLWPWIDVLSPFDSCHHDFYQSSYPPSWLKKHPLRLWFKYLLKPESVQLLQRKLELRFPDELKDAGRDYGVPLADIQHLVTRWKDQYDWRKHEKQMNEDLPQFKRDIQVDGFGTLGIHYIHKMSEVQDVIPLLFVHGCK